VQFRGDFLKLLASSLIRIIHRYTVSERDWTKPR